MVVTIKVLVNGDEINQAKEKNQFYANKRKHNETLAKSKRIEVPDDVEVPEPIVKESTMLIDSKDVTRARRNEIGMIQIIHSGKDMQIVDNPETWAILEKRFAE